MSLEISSKMKTNVVTCIHLALAKFPQVRQIWTYAGFPDHNDCRCCDYMITIEGIAREQQVELGDEIKAWHIAHADDLGVNYIIWNRRIWRRVGNGHGPARQSTAYYGPKPHTDHVHVEYDNRKPTAPGPVKYLPPYWVDPAAVDTWLWGVRVRDGKNVKKRKPGFKITTGVAIAGPQLVTAAGYAYDLAYLTTTDPKENPAA